MTFETATPGDAYSFEFWLKHRGNAGSAFIYAEANERFAVTQLF